MNSRIAVAMFLFASLSLAPVRMGVIADEASLLGYSAESSRAERQWEEKLRAIPNPENLRAYMQGFAPAVRDIFESFEFHIQID